MIENIKNVGVEVNNHYDTIERSYVQMILGGIYINKTNNNEYQLIEYLEDINQAVFKNLFDQRNEVLCVHDFKNVSSNNDVSVKVDLDEISDEDWQ